VPKWYLRLVDWLSRLRCPYHAELVTPDGCWTVRGPNGYLTFGATDRMDFVFRLAGKLNRHEITEQEAASEIEKEHREYVAANFDWDEE
jgi:hypothetical protein